MMSTIAKRIAAQVTKKLLVQDSDKSREEIHAAIVEEFSKLSIGSELRLRLDEKQRPYLELAIGNENSGWLTEIF